MRITRSADPHAEHWWVSWVTVEPTGDAYPLRIAMRIAFAVVVLAAYGADFWIIGNWTDRPASAQRTLTLLAFVALAGVVSAIRPNLVVVAATAASSLSLVETIMAIGHHERLGFFAEFVVLPVLFAALLVQGRRTRWTVGVVLAVAAEAISLRTDYVPVRAILAMSVFVLLAAGFAAVMYVRLRDRERRTSVENARQAERLDLARELHDIVGHHVTGIVVLAQASRFTSGAAPGSPADRALAEIETAGIETLASVRRLLGMLRADPTTSSGPRFAVVEKLVEDLRSTHPSTDLIVDDLVRESWVPADLANTVQRLVQEAATNVRRHGDPNALVQFIMRNTGDSFELVVENRMLHPTVDTGFGVIGMTERVDALGGKFHAGPSGNGQWRVRAELPMLEGVA
jgi:signal transduction histidine kinase